MIYPRYLISWDKSQLSTLNRILYDLISYVNRWIFGSGRKHDLEVTDTGPADTNFTVTHNLGYQPSGWILYYQDKAGSLYLVSWNENQAIFRFSADNAHIKFRLF